MTKTTNKRWSLGRRVVLLQFAVAIAASPVSGQEEDTPPPGMPADFIAAFYGPQKPDPVKYPWVDPKLSPDRRAEWVLAQLTLAEKLQLLHGVGRPTREAGGNGGAGQIPGIPRLAVPPLSFADASNGVTRNAQESRYSTALPSTLAKAATWHPELAYQYGAVIGRELRDQGHNAALAFGLNLIREPRGGRNFEYPSEDPVLAGKIIAQAVLGVQDQHVLATLKHYAINPQETGRHDHDALIDYAAARESDLLAFEIAVRDAQPAMIMCAYNKVNGVYACENDELLNRTLKQEWGFKGFVISDWVATHSTEKALLAGLDMEQPFGTFFGEPLSKAVQEGRVPQAAIDNAARRILRAIFAMDLPNHPVDRRVVDVKRGLAVAQEVVEQGAVLLKNTGGVLPLASDIRTVAVIGGHADVGVLTGGGSGQVEPPGGNAVPSLGNRPKVTARGLVMPETYWPSSPLEALRVAAPQVRFTYDDGTVPARAAALAASSDVAILFATQPSGEEMDRSLSLRTDQNAMIATVAKANPRSIVVLETGGAVLMPWIDDVSAVVEAWYPGASGGPALARLLTGRVNFSGKLPVTFPASEADLPRPIMPGSDLPLIPDTFMPKPPPFSIRYDEGALVGYKWFQAKRKPPLFSFGHGLSYTTFAYSGLMANSNTVTFSVSNTGQRAGAEVAQVYAALPAALRRAPLQLVGWTRVDLQPGESRQVTVALEPLALSRYDAKLRRWIQPKGRYEIFVGGSSSEANLRGGFIR
jgi:beta-glucosidase